MTPLAALNSPFVSPRSAVSAALVGALFLALASCERPGSAVVEWPEMRSFDELVVVAEGFVLAGETGGALAMREALAESGRALSPGSAPASARRPREVERLLEDLASVTERFSDPDLDGETMGSLVLGLHLLVDALMEAAGMPHVHENEGPNDGFLSPLYAESGDQAGMVEIKLHDDAGDIEVWVTRGASGEPWGLPLDTVATLNFEVMDRRVSLAVRDSEENANEDGVGQIRDGLTHYFVFPGETGEDPEWLIGEEFAARAVLTFETEADGLVRTESFILRPHVH